MLDDYDKLASLKDLAQREKWGGDFNAPTAAIPPRRFIALHIFQFVNFHVKNAWKIVTNSKKM